MIWQEELNSLKAIQPTGDLMIDMEVKDKILELELKLGLKKSCSLDSDEECLSCGS